MGDHTRNYCAAIYFFLVRYIFFLHEPRVIDPALSSDGDKVGWCLTKRGRTRGCINKEKLGSNTRKNTIQKNCHTKNVRVFLQKNTYKKIHTKNTYKKYIQKIHTKNCHTKKLLCIIRIQKITIQKIYYVVHTHKNHIQKNYHTKNLLCILTHKKLPYKKNVSVFSTHTKKYYVIHAKKLLVFFPIQKITMYYTHTKKYYIIHHTKKLLCIFSHTKNYCVLHAKKITYKKMLVFFPYKKLLCSALIQKITSIFFHTKNY